MQNKISFTNPDWVFIICALIASVAGLYGINSQSGSMMLILCGALLIFGLPHGAFDVILIRNYFKNNHVPYVLLFYVLLAVLSAIVWLLFPSLFIAGFLLISIFHFGDSDWPLDHKLLKCAWGSAVIGLPAFFHKQDVINLFSWFITPVDAVLIVNLLAWIAIPMVVLFVWYCRKNVTQIYSVILLIPIYFLLPPLLSFTFYFTIFHARRHLIYWHQRLTSKTERKLLFWITLIITTIVLVFAANTSSIFLFNKSLFVVTIITLACLTVPHMLMIYFAHRKDHRSLSHE